MLQSWKKLYRETARKTMQIGAGSHITVVTDQTQVRVGDCVNVEQAGSGTANVRRVSQALGEYKINLLAPDNGEKFAINLSNATFTTVEGFIHDNPDLSITINRSDLEQVMMDLKSFAASIEDGTAKAVGNADILAQIAQTLVTFQIGFEVLPGTAAPAKEVDLNPYSVAEDSVFMSGE
jgi:hypothetical protein